MTDEHLRETWSKHERLQQIWRHYHEVSRLNRYQRQDLDSLEVHLHQLEKEMANEP